MHKIENIQQKIKDCGIKINKITGGLKRYFQILDVSTNKPFKDELKKNTDYCMEQEEIYEKVSKEN